MDNKLTVEDLDLLIIPDDNIQVIQHDQVKPIYRSSSTANVISISLIYVIAALAAFGLLARDLAYLIGIGVIVGAGAGVSLLTLHYRRDLLTSLLAGGFTIALICSTSMEASVFQNVFRISESLQHISWVAIILILLAFVAQSRVRR